MTQTQPESTDLVIDGKQCCTNVREITLAATLRP